jgi:predicted phosphoribosyltransferase
MEHRTLSLGFHDLHDAGRSLAQALLQHRDWSDPVVLALPRGGVPVGFEVSALLDAPLDVLMVRTPDHPNEEDLARRAALYRDDCAEVALQGREAILVADGIADAAQMRAAIEALRRHHPASITVGVPVGDVEAVDALRSVADEVLCVRSPAPFGAVADWYAEYPQVHDEEVRSLLERSRRMMAT